MNPLRKLKIKNVRATVLAACPEKTGTSRTLCLAGIHSLSSVLAVSTTPGTTPHHSGTSLAKASDVTVIQGDLLCPDAVNQFSRIVAYRWHQAGLNYHGFKFSRAVATHCLLMRIYKVTDIANMSRTSS